MGHRKEHGSLATITGIQVNVDTAVTGIIPAIGPHMIAVLVHFGFEYIDLHTQSLRQHLHGIQTSPLDLVQLRAIAVKMHLALGGIRTLGAAVLPYLSLLLCHLLAVDLLALLVGNLPLGIGELLRICHISKQFKKFHFAY